MFGRGTKVRSAFGRKGNGEGRSYVRKGGRGKLKRQVLSFGSLFIAKWRGEGEKRKRDAQATSPLEGGKERGGETVDLRIP